MSKVPKWIKNKERSLQKRISQSMRDAGYANGNCCRLQRQWNRIRRVKQALRGL
jgi:hypothetical protein